MIGAPIAQIRLIQIRPIRSVFGILNKELKTATNVGVATLAKNDNGQTFLQLYGFGGIDETTHVILRDDGNILTLEIDQNAPLERCVVFNKANKETKILIDYFEEFDAINALFVRVGNTYIQCKGVKVKV